MNKFIGSGLIMNIAFREENSGIPHTIISLGMRHKTRAGETRRETYRVSAWNTTALWAKDNLRVGQIIALLGYLTQRTTKDGHSTTEIAAEEFIPSLQTSYSNDQPSSPSGANDTDHPEMPEGSQQRNSEANTTGITSEELSADFVDPVTVTDIEPTEPSNDSLTGIDSETVESILNEECVTIPAQT